jgi:TetR/AcrR family transcriptional regulator, cholesterol catabolism regulator
MVAVERILKGSEELFLQSGIRSVTMDDIARNLGISKKTIYHYFRDKNELINILVDKRLKEDCDQLRALINSSKNMIEELVTMTKGTEDVFSRINPIVVHDLQKYYPDAWMRFQTFKTEFLINTLEMLLFKGIQQGYIRPDADARILAIMRVNQIEMGFNTTKFPLSEFNVWKVQHQLLTHFNYGICTLKGIEILNKHKNMEEN